MKKILLVITALLFMVSIGYCQESHQLPQVIINSSKEVYEAAEPIFLTVTFKNLNDYVITVGIQNVFDSDFNFWLIDTKDGQYTHIKSDGDGVPRDFSFETLRRGEYVQQRGDITTIYKFTPGTYKIQAQYPGERWYGDSEEHQRKHKPDTENFILGVSTSNTITIEVVENRLPQPAAKSDEEVEKPAFEAVKFIKRSVGQGDYVYDERLPKEACETITKSVCDDNPGFDCELVDSGRIDSPEQFDKCVDGATIGGCFTCTFKCIFIESDSGSVNTAGKVIISKEEALMIAQEVCKKEGWEWKDVYIEERKGIWEIHTNSGALGSNAFISIDKKTGKVLKKFFNPE